VVDPTTFEWTDHSWGGLSPKDKVIYEMHIGTFTQEGTWDAANRELAELVDIGVTVLEVMPVADFPGRFGWGYGGAEVLRSWVTTN
jgi:maltooligosyltrehalose trehalohydrolase